MEVAVSAACPAVDGEVVGYADNAKTCREQSTDEEDEVDEIRDIRGADAIDSNDTCLNVD